MPLASKISNYFKESKAELNKVIWPTSKETMNHTLAVVGISLATAIFLGMLDFVFKEVLRIFIIK